MVLQMRTSTSWSRIKSGGFGDALLVRVGSSWMSQLGQSGKNSVRVYVFRCAHKLGHCLTQLALRTCANAHKRNTPNTDDLG
jgi:hypothetical protein